MSEKNDTLFPSGTVAVRLRGAVDRLSLALEMGDGNMLETAAAETVEIINSQTAGSFDHVARLMDLGVQVATVGHELRQPLLAIKGFAQLLLERVDDTKYVSSTVKTILHQSLHMEAIVDRLRTYTRPVRADKLRCDPKAAVESAVGLIAGSLREQRQVLSVETADLLPEVAIGGVAIQQILVNLLSNARDAVGEGGTIRLSARRDGERVVIEVADDGPGIPEHVRARLFEPFVTSKDEGTGLGLWLSRSIAEKAGGALEYVPSERGAVFALCLPILVD
ncbi:MAG: hypothetical protein A2289_18905 [Deltaproteobacteria bacterium RIFOXYA12_FULL_58_15]|nr:MAG: hypothetical protein A2289_18905 [Deltaproteobacteria bacterium RIFOXYA12_FULL_58_15]OGR08689.1 MAG: hypothetical protein A2341_00650 [Deltaproteobacteria bacterium RIFOXYB12_FULL_58_9]